MIEITASEPERHVQISVGRLIIGRVTLTTIEDSTSSKEHFKISGYDSDDGAFYGLRKMVQPGHEPYKSFKEAAEDLLDQRGYGPIAVEADGKTLENLCLMRRVTL